MAHFNKLSNGSAKKDYCFKKLFGVCEKISVN